MNNDDPHLQSEDLGVNAMKAGEYGIKNLKNILAGLSLWTKESGEGYEKLAEMYIQLTGDIGALGEIVKTG